MVDGDVPPQLILELLKTRAFLAQMPAQGLRADVQVLGDRLQVQPATGIPAEQAPQLAAQAVAIVGAGQQVGGGAAEELFERAFVLLQRHAQVTAAEQQAAGGGVEAQGARKQQVVFTGVVGPRVTEAGLEQANALADQPTAQAVPDHQQAFAEKVIRVPQVRGVQAQAHAVAFAAELQAWRVGEQAVEQQAAVQGLFQGRTMNQRMHHHGESAALAAALAEPQVFVVQLQPEPLQQLGELLWRQACPRFVEPLRSDAQALQQRRTAVVLPTRTLQGGAGEVAGDAAFTHGALPSIEWPMLVMEMTQGQGGYPPKPRVLWGGWAETRHLCCKGDSAINPARDDG